MKAGEIRGEEKRANKDVYSDYWDMNDEDAERKWGRGFIGEIELGVKREWVVVIFFFIVVALLNLLDGLKIKITIKYFKTLLANINFGNLKSW